MLSMGRKFSSIFLFQILIFNQYQLTFIRLVVSLIEQIHLLEALLHPQLAHDVELFPPLSPQRLQLAQPAQVRGVDHHMAEARLQGAQHLATVELERKPSEVQRVELDGGARVPQDQVLVHIEGVLSEETIFVPETRG